MNKTTRLTQQDLKIYPSQRLTDTPDGGGLMVGTPLTGADNELFSPVSDVDRTLGSFDARLVYPGVLRNDTEPLYGAHVIISQPPAATNVSYLCFKANGYGDSRQEIMPRVEAYSVPTIEGRMTLMGRHLVGMRLIQAYQRPEAPLPRVGERYCLEMRNASGTVQRYQYFRIENLSHELRVFEVVENQQIVEITRRMIKMEIGSPLEYDFNGIEHPVRGYHGGLVRILETQVSDSAKYYGVRPLAKPVKKGDASIQVDSIFEKLVPTSTIETPWVDRYPVNAEMWVATGPRRVFGSSGNGALYFGFPVVPGSVQAEGWADNGLGSLVSGNSTALVDYAAGSISSPGLVIRNISAIPGAKVSGARHSTYVDIKETNQGLSWAPLLQPAPAAGSLTVSFMAQGVWYTLRDPGDMTLRDESGEQVGVVSVYGSSSVTLPALPDVGSRLVFAWGDASMYQAYDGSAAGSSSPVKVIGGAAVSLPAQVEDFIKPGTLRLSWGSGQAASDSNGVLSGNATGLVDYYAGKVAVSSGLAAGAVQISYQAYSGAVKDGEIQKSNSDRLDVTIGRVQPGSFGMSLRYGARAKAAQYQWIQLKYNQSILGGSNLGGSIIASKKHDVLSKISDTEQELSGYQTFYITDNGAGGLMADGVIISGASIDYATGRVRIPALSETGLLVYVSGNWVDDAPAVVGAVAARRLSLSGNAKTVTDVDCWIDGAAYRYISDGATKQVSITETPSNVSANVIQASGYAGRPVLDSWSFEVSGKNIVERGGVLFADFNMTTGAGARVGVLNPDSGQISVSDPKLDLSSLKITGGVISKETAPIALYCGRTDSAPVKPESFTVWLYDGEKMVVGRSDDAGKIINADSAAEMGAIDYETGFYSVKMDNGFQPDLLRFNAVTLDNIPLDSSIIGIDAVRLPQDGRVPIFRKGDMVVIGSRAKHDLGSAHSAGQTVSLGRADLDRVSIIDAENKPVDAKLYDVDLAAGTLKWADGLSLAAYTMPLAAMTAREEENRLVGVDISGKLKLQFAVSRDYDAGAYVSSALVAGDLLVRSTEPFAQRAWGNKWADEREGDAILAALNVKDYPITLVSAGAITERWLIRFEASSAQFKLYGERLGLVAEGDILTDLKPTNPATNKPYFTLPHLAFGGGWAVGNCIRFNTYGTPVPVWVLRAVQPSAESQTEKDGFACCLRGNTIDV